MLLALVLSFGAMYAQKPVELNKASFIEKVFDFEKGTEWKYKGDKPAIIDFYADWCGPCKRIAPHLADIAADYAGKVVVYKVNVDNNREIAQAFGVRGIPMVLFVPVQGDYQKSVGSMARDAYYKAVKDVLKVD